MDVNDSLPAEMSPSRYVEKVSLATGEVLDDEIRPEELLVRAHRDYHLADIQARHFMSLLMKRTGDERLVMHRMHELRRLGRRASKTVARILGGRDPSKVAEVLFGLKERHAYFRFKKPTEARCGGPAGAMPATAFRHAVERELDLATFQRRTC